MIDIEKALACRAAAVPAVLEASEASLVERGRLRSARSRADDPVVPDCQRNERRQRNRETPRRQPGTAGVKKSEPPDEGNCGYGAEAHVADPRVEPVEAVVGLTPRREPPRVLVEWWK